MKLPLADHHASAMVASEFQFSNRLEKYPLTNPSASAILPPSGLSTKFVGKYPLADRHASTIAPRVTPPTPTRLPPRVSRGPPIHPAGRPAATLDIDRIIRERREKKAAEEAREDGPLGKHGNQEGERNSRNRVDTVKSVQGGNEQTYLARRLGEMLAEMELKTNQHGAGNTMLPALSDHGITKMQSSRWQAEARVVVPRPPTASFYAFLGIDPTKHHVWPGTQ